MLTGTHIGLYGKDLEQGKAADRAGGRNWHKAQDKAGEYAHGEKIDLPLVVRKLTEIDGLIRLRISSLEPHDVTPELIHCLRFPQVCNHLHLPIQSGSDKVLKLMGRRYDVAGFLDIVNQVRKVVPDIGLSADVIVGFPGETEEDFESTLDVISRVKFSRLHVFKFSPRPGTQRTDFPERCQGRKWKGAARRLLPWVRNYL